jgi:hypothetical protein
MTMAGCAPLDRSGQYASPVNPAGKAKDSALQTIEIYVSTGIHLSISTQKI